MQKSFNMNTYAHPFDKTSLSFLPRVILDVGLVDCAIL